MTDVKFNEYKLDEDHSAPVADGNDNAGNDQGDQPAPTEEAPVEETPMETPAAEETPADGGDKPAEGGESKETPAL